MERSLKGLAQVLGSTADTANLPQYFARAKASVKQFWLRDLFLVTTLAGFAEAHKQARPEFDRQAVARFLCDEPLQAKINAVTKDLSGLREPETVLRCLLRHETTFAALREHLQAIWPALGQDEEP